ncbi:MAG: universal stress protein [Opitutaceae bacterium]|nr:universal stress protein [Opitutaceae bacterium]
MKTFLLPVDFSPVTADVIESALSFARAFAGRVALLHVVQPPYIASARSALPPEAIAEAVAVAEEEAERKLAAHARTFARAGIECSVRMLSGRPVPLILKEAKRARADFIIMGSHGHGRIYDLLVGSTASGVIKQATCGVILLPPEDKAYE